MFRSNFRNIRCVSGLRELSDGLWGRGRCVCSSFTQKCPAHRKSAVSRHQEVNFLHHIMLAVSLAVNLALSLAELPADVCGDVGALRSKTLGEGHTSKRLRCCWSERVSVVQHAHCDKLESGVQKFSHPALFVGVKKKNFYIYIYF